MKSRKLNPVNGSAVTLSATVIGITVLHSFRCTNAHPYGRCTKKRPHKHHLGHRAASGTIRCTDAATAQKSSSYFRQAAQVTRSATVVHVRMKQPPPGEGRR